MSHRLPENIGSSFSHFMSAKDLSSEDHFNWISARNFVYFASVYSSHIFTLDLFSDISFPRGQIVYFIILAIVAGIPYMCADVFIKQYTKRIDFNDAMCPLLKVIIVVTLLQSAILNVLETLNAGDAARYLLSSVYGPSAWSRCHSIRNTSTCITPAVTVRFCNEHKRFFFNDTSAHVSYRSYFNRHDRAIITTRLFVNCVLWILNFFISTVSDSAILKFFKIVFWFDSLSTIFVSCILIFVTGFAYTALTEIMSMKSESLFDEFMLTFDEVAVVYGIGALGVYDLGMMSVFTLVDNAVIMFSGVYIFFAFMRSMIIKMLYLHFEDCAEFEYPNMTRHYINFAVLPLSTEFLYGQKLYTTYIYLRMIIIMVAYLTLHTLTVTKIIHSYFRSVRSVYIVAIVCLLGFVSSVPIILVRSQNAIVAGLFYGRQISSFYLGAIRMGIIMWMYGVKKFATDIHFWLSFKPTKFWTLTWMLLPAILLVRCVMIIYEKQFMDSTVSTTILYVWFVLIVFIVTAHHIKTIVCYVLRNNFIGAFKCSKKYGPPDLADRVLRRNYNSTIYHRQCFHNCMLLDEGIDCNHLPLMNKEQKSSADDENASLMHLFEAGPSRTSSSFLNMDDYLHLG